MAKAMVALKQNWSGTLVLVGQPAEELILGAKAMVATASTPSTTFPSRTTSAFTPVLAPRE